MTDLGVTIYHIYHNNAALRLACVTLSSDVDADVTE
jgi:hypothetical protein